ncbi:DeoR/GlpR family DNA-binding transcription regulator [Limnohabitans sp. 2KL-27]|jgi:DeoR family glycerol-3-phosphate regulon repressor|uniref:DeoR/GlpR family DNA-binding transcription regulator n=1 Tax=Limnohabitans sp. 2KL-27 TaxID=1100705 RepID=UPI000A3FF11B|nr:DeoR/GlpR family DNA-binding transcription regulator [Limnohabitans sp. 2KL-27]
MTDALTPRSRREKILELVKQAGYMPIEALTLNFQVTPQTIRVDLNVLADEGRVVRHHGGASIPSSVTNTDYESRRSDFAGVKSSLAQAVSNTISDKSAVFMALGTTMLAMAAALSNRKGLKIITNHTEAALMLAKQPGFDVVVLGGRLDPRNLGTTGPMTLEAVANYRPDVCIFSAGGIDTEGNILDYYEHEAAIVRLMIKRSRRSILAVDHSKFGRSASVLVGNVADIHQLFTDKPPPAGIKKLLKLHKTDLIQVPQRHAGNFHGRS